MMRGLAAAAALALAPAAATAGDMASVEVIGFSADGSVFAFEEYGVQDGSGFPYANRYYIDTASDGFLPGTPIRVRIDDEAAGLDAAREQAREQSERIVAQDTLAANRGFAAGWNPPTEVSADPHRIAVNPRPVVPPIDDVLEFRLEEHTFSTSETCQSFGETKGFRLLRIATTAGDVTEVLHDDESIPESRGCPLGYRLGGVQTFFPDDGDPVYAVLVAVVRAGFEGPDHRWIAITGKLGD